MKKNQTKSTGPIDAEMSARIKKLPEFLKSIPEHGSKNKEYHKVLGAMNNLKADDCIPYTAAEFLEKFGKYGKNSLGTFLKKNGIAKPRIIEDNGIFYIKINDKFVKIKVFDTVIDLKKPKKEVLKDIGKLFKESEV